MIKKLKLSVLLIILGEILSFALDLFGNNDISEFGEFTTGVLLGISVGMKLIGIILLVAVITTILVYGVNAAENLMEKNNNKYTSTVNGIEDWFNTTEEVDTTEESSNLFNITSYFLQYHYFNIKFGFVCLFVHNYFIILCFLI